MGNYYLYKTAIFLTRLLPIRMSFALAGFLSECQYLLSKSDREAVKSNLRAILKTEHVPAASVRDVFRNFGKYLANFFLMPRMLDKKYIQNHVQIGGSQNLDEALKKGKGAIILSAHIGNWEMAGSVLSLLGYPLSVIALAHKDPRVNGFFNRQREFFGTEVIQTNVSLRRCIDHLKRNRLVAILGDRDFGHHGITMDFLDKKAIIPSGPAFFSLRTGSPIIPAFFIGTANNGFYINFGEPIYPPAVDPKNIDKEHMEGLIKRYLSFMEQIIRQHPTQWLVFRPFEAA